MTPKALVSFFKIMNIEVPGAIAVTWLNIRVSQFKIMIIITFLKDLNLNSQITAALGCLLQKEHLLAR